MRCFSNSRIISLIFIGLFWLSTPVVFGQVDVLEQIEAELQAEKEKQKALEKSEKNAEKFAIKYRQTITKADALVKSEKYVEALEAYKEALIYKPDDHYAPEQLKETERLKKHAEEEEKKKALLEAFQAKMNEGNAALSSKEWAKAIALYEEAKKLKPDEPEPNSKIAKAKKLQTKEEEERKAKEAAEALQKKYDDLISEADKLLSSESYDEARVKFEEASKLKPSEQIPKNKILECDKLKAEALARKKAEETQKQFDEIISSADQLLKEEKFDEARAKYDEAVKLKPEENFPHNQIAECDRLKKEFLQKQKDDQYQALIEQAAQLLKDNQFDEAKTKYEASLKFKPGDNYATNQVIACDKQKKEFANKLLDEKYQAIIDEADGLLKEKKFDDAKIKYEEAFKLKPNDNYAHNQVTECDKQKKAFALQELTDQFDEIISEGDEFLKNNEFDKAVETYDRAHKLMPDNETGPSKVAEATRLKKEFENKIKEAEFEKLLNEGDELVKNEKFESAIELYAQAEHLFPENAEAPIRIQKAKQLKKELETKNIEERYSKLLSEGDDFLKAKEYEKARTSYTEAERLLPDHQDAQKKVHELNELIKAEELSIKQAKYDRFISKGDSLLSIEQYDESESQYRLAHQTKPDESLPNSKIQECHKLKAEMLAKLKAEASEKEKQEKFSSLISEARQFHNDSNYQKAINTYHLALEVISNHEDAVSGLEESQKALTEMKKREQARAKEIAHQNEMERQYLDLINSGDKALGQREFATAREKYNNAGTILPDRQEHKDKLDEADRVEKSFVSEQENEKRKADSLLAAKKELELKTKEREEKTEQYEVLLDKGNKALAVENFDKAIDAYSAAMELLPEDPRASRKLENTRKAKLEKNEELLAEKREKEAAAAAMAKKKAEESEKKEKEAQYEDLIGKGQMAIKSSKFDEALKAFEEAEVLLPGRHQTAGFIATAKKRLEEQQEAKSNTDKQARFESFFKAAETAYKNGDYDLAFASIDQAKQIKPDYPLLLTLEKKVEKKALEEEERMARQLALQQRNSSQKSDFTVVYLDPKRRERLDEINFVHHLATKYPEGLTVQYRTDDRKEIEVRIVVQQSLGAEYQKITHSWGGTYYFKNGKNISAYIWQKEAGGF